MQIHKPQVHLKKEETAQGIFTFHIHVVTWMEQTRFVADGHEAISNTSTAGVYAVRLNIREDSNVPDMKLLTPVVHTLTLTGINFPDSAPFIEVESWNTTLTSSIGNRKVHRDDADNSAMEG